MIDTATKGDPNTIPSLLEQYQSGCPENVRTDTEVNTSTQSAFFCKLGATSISTNISSSVKNIFAFNFFPYLF